MSLLDEMEKDGFLDFIIRDKDENKLVLMNDINNGFLVGIENHGATIEVQLSKENAIKLLSFLSNSEGLTDAV